MTSDASEKAALLQRKLFRQNIYRIWSMVKADKRDELSEKENNFAEILLDHEEYSDHFENMDILDGREYEAGAVFNPFLHLSTHLMVGNQLSAESPLEAAILYEALEGKGLSHHEAMHFIIMALVHVMHESASSKRPFDDKRYRRLLARCREVEPSEIERIIEEDLANNRSCH